VAVKAIARRLRRLEDQLGPADGKPRGYFRIVLIRLDRIPGFEGATCRRMLWPDGTLSENEVLGTSSDGREPTEEELDQWVATFPIEPFSTKLCIVPLPTDIHGRISTCRAPATELLPPPATQILSFHTLRDNGELG
jgi:hypothetical protein